MCLAHISDDKKREQSIIEHARGTAELAGQFAKEFNCAEWGYGCGLLHDIGKYSERFQKRLHGGPKVDHATAGAKELYRKNNYIGAYCIAGHHSGLPDGGTVEDQAGESTFRGRMEKELDDYHVYQEEIQIPEFSNIPLKPIGTGGFSVSFFIRMLFSCLVDADFLDTERFMSDHSIERGGYDSMEILHERLSRNISKWMTNTDMNSINGRRTAILKACLQMGGDDKGLFQLTVPTGGGKTIASLAFALQHAVKHQMKHIIYIIPFTSIIEQTSEVFKGLLGRANVLEDHSNVSYDDDKEAQHCQRAAENWDFPVVVTTNVQFFESLFSNKTSKCRKLHNISNSIIVFDEAQMLPVPYLIPCIQAISELVYNYNSTAVICTATQPSLRQFYPSELKVKEICPDVEAQYLFFKRSLIRNIGEISQDMLIEQLRENRQVLCILNSRKRVQRVYEALEGDGTYQLSTLMYPNHRVRVLKEIRENLAADRPCRLIATSLVEAGIDFDFPIVYRELAGVDSVIQAAGRCNREGKRDLEDSITTVFTLTAEKDIHLPGELKLPVKVAEEVARKYSDLSSLEAISDYFHRLYHYKGQGLDAKDIVRQFEEGGKKFLIPFAAIAKNFNLIENKTKTILIDLESEAEDIVNRIKRGEYSRKLLREAGHYCINVYQQDFDKLCGAGLLEEIDKEFYILRKKEQYTMDMGLIMNVSRGDAVFW